jgi:hypothetical protein
MLTDHKSISKADPNNDPHITIRLPGVLALNQGTTKQHVRALYNTTYINGHIDKQHIPLYLFLSGAGTGKSRNAAELHKTAYDCFNGTHFPKNKDGELAKREEELAQMLENPFIFYISLENGTSLSRLRDQDPWKAIGSRMLLQLLGEPDNTGWKLRTRIDQIIKKWHP